jgi:hypothetical protein
MGMNTILLSVIHDQVYTCRAGAFTAIDNYHLSGFFPLIDKEGTPEDHSTNTAMTSGGSVLDIGYIFI